MMFLVVGCGEDDYKSSSNANDVESVLDNRSETVDQEDIEMINIDIFHFTLQKLAEMDEEIYVFGQERIVHSKLGHADHIVIKSADLSEGWVEITTNYLDETMNTIVQIDDANGLNELYEGNL